MITNDNENWNYLTIKSLSRLLRGITSNHDGDFCCLNCFHSYRAKETLKNIKKYGNVMIIVLEKCLTKIKKY